MNWSKAFDSSSRVWAKHFVNGILSLRGGDLSSEPRDGDGVCNLVRCCSQCDDRGVGAIYFDDGVVIGA